MYWWIYIFNLSLTCLSSSSADVVVDIEGEQQTMPKLTADQGNDLLEQWKETLSCLHLLSNIKRAHQQTSATTAVCMRFRMSPILLCNVEQSWQTKFSNLFHWQISILWMLHPCYSFLLSNRCGSKFGYENMPVNEAYDRDIIHTIRLKLKGKRKQALAPSSDSMCAKLKNYGRQ